MPLPTLFLICGMPGSGKTTLAKQLENTHPAIRLSSDEWIVQIIADPTNKPELDRLRDPIESLQWNLAQKLLIQGLSVNLENGFWSKQERMALQAQALGARVELHYLDVPIEELWRRLEKRNANLPADCFRVTRPELELWMTWFEPPNSEEISNYDNFKEQIRNP